MQHTSLKSLICSLISFVELWYGPKCQPDLRRSRRYFPRRTYSVSSHTSCLRVQPETVLNSTVCTPLHTRSLLTKASDGIGYRDHRTVDYSLRTKARCVHKIRIEEIGLCRLFTQEVVAQARLAAQMRSTNRSIINEVIADSTPDN